MRTRKQPDVYADDIAVPHAETGIVWLNAAEKRKARNDKQKAKQASKRAALEW